MKDLLNKLLPRFIIHKLQRLKLTMSLRKPYSRIPFALTDLPAAPSSSSYALFSEKESEPFCRVMRKFESYIAAGPIGPNKYWEYPWVLRNLDLQPGQKILDAGCGRAPVQYMLADLGLGVSAIDPNENVGWHGIDRRLARKYGLKIDYRVEGMEKISYPDETFDRVISVSVIEHCRAQRVKDELRTPQTEADRKLQGRMMSEMARVLKKGGLLVITVDIIFPEYGADVRANVDIKNLAEASGLELLKGSITEGLYGYTDFDMAKLMAKPDLDVQDYAGVKGTSLGLVFRK